MQPKETVKPAIIREAFQKTLSLLAIVIQVQILREEIISAIENYDWIKLKTNSSSLFISFENKRAQEYHNVNTENKNISQTLSQIDILQYYCNNLID